MADSREVTPDIAARSAGRKGGWPGPVGHDRIIAPAEVRSFRKKAQRARHLADEVTSDQSARASLIAYAYADDLDHRANEIGRRLDACTPTRSINKSGESGDK